MQVDAACDTSELISTNENVQQQSKEKPDQQNRAKPDPTTVQEQNRVHPDPTTQPTRGLNRKRNPILSTEPEVLEIDRMLPSCGVTEAKFQQWKPKPLEVKKRTLILELDKVLTNMRVMTPRRDRNQFLEWVVQHFDLFACSEKPRTDVLKNHAQKDASQNSSSISRECGHEKTMTSTMLQGSNYLRIGGLIGQNIMPTIH